MRFLTSILVTSVVFLAADVFFPRQFHVHSIFIAVLAAVILSVLNAILKPLLTLLSLPLMMISFGLFSFIINAVILELTIHIVGKNLFASSSFLSTLMLAIALAVVHSIVSSKLDEKRK